MNWGRVSVGYAGNLLNSAEINKQPRQLNSINTNAANDLIIEAIGAKTYEHPQMDFLINKSIEPFK